MDLSQLLQQAKQGDRTARAGLITLAYEDLRRLARHQMRNERPDHSLTATALVHEVSAQLLERSQVPSGGSDAYLAYVATAMRRVLIDHARGKRRKKRGGSRQKLQLEEAFVAAEEQPAELLELNDALQKLVEIDPRRGQVVEMRYFGGLGIAEIAATLDVSPATVKRDFQVAKLWLARQLDQGDTSAE